MAGIRGMRFGLRKKKSNDRFDFTLESMASINEKVMKKSEEELDREYDDFVNTVSKTLKTRSKNVEQNRPKTYEEIRTKEEREGTRSDKDRALDILWDLMQKEKSEGVTEDEVQLAGNLASVISVDMN